MLRPSRPMIRPFMSSLGRSTTETVVSMAWSAALALDGLGDDLLRPLDGRLARLGLEPLDEVGGVAPRVGFDLLEQEVPRFVGREARHALELALTIGEQLLALRCHGLRSLLQLADRRVARAQIPLDLLGCRDAIGERARPVGERLLEP